MNRHFTNEAVRMINNHTDQHSASLVVREMKCKPQCDPTARPRMVNIVMKTREETEPPDSHLPLDETENGTIALEKLGHKVKYPPTLHIYPREIKVWVQKSVQEYL